MPKHSNPQSPSDDPLIDDLARVGAEVQLRAIREHFPDVLQRVLAEERPRPAKATLQTGGSGDEELDAAVEVLRAAGKPMKVGEVAAQLKGAGRDVPIPRLGKKMAHAKNLLTRSKHGTYTLAA